MIVESNNKNDYFKKGISAYILTKNNEKTIKNALNSVKWANEIIIVDGLSEDGTINICREYGEKVKIFQRKFEGFDNERNFAISKCQHKWVIEIDADETYSENLQDSIKKVINSDTDYGAFKIKRIDHFLKRYLTTLKLVRLYRNGKAKYYGSTHECIKIKGKTSPKPLLGICNHHPNDTNSLFDIIKQMDRETEKELLKRFKNKEMSLPIIFINMTLRPIFLFFGILIYKKFILSGMPGFIWALNNSYYEFLIYVKYYERKYIQKDRKVKKEKMRNL